MRSTRNNKKKNLRHVRGEESQRNEVRTGVMSSEMNGQGNCIRREEP